MGHHHHDDGEAELCICFHVPVRKVFNYCRNQRPAVASLISECFSAGTGCGWCVPYIKAIHNEIVRGGPPAEIPDPEAYALLRNNYRKDGQRPKD